MPYETTTFLTNIRRTVKLYDSMLRPVCDQYNLSSMEVTIISFLYNNPSKDTAADIVELRMLSKGNVSKAVENLIQKSLLQRQQDREDRRKIHLSLTPAAKPVTQKIERVKQTFRKQVFRGFSAEEQALFIQLNNRIAENAKIEIERGESFDER